MKLSFTKKAILLIVAISLLTMIFSTCSIKSSQYNSTTNKNLLSGADTTDVNLDKDPLGKYNPAIDISFVRAIDGDLENNTLPNSPGETIEDNRWLKLYREQLGINIKYNWTIKGGYTEEAYNQKINITLASGELPDVITVNSSQLKQLVDSDMIQDMTQIYLEYASPLTKDVYTQEGTSVLDSAKFNGKLMAIPNLDSSIEGAQFFWIRVDWLKKLGLEPPKTMDDLLKISKDFTTMDPDGNGKADTYGLAITKDLYNGCIGLEGFFACFHAYPGIWQENGSGKLVYGSIQPQTRTALLNLAEMYKTKQIDKEFCVKDYTKVAEDIASGKIGIQIGEQWNPFFPLNGSLKNDNTADWQGVSLLSADNKPVKVPLKFRTYMYFGVKKGFKYPEAVVKLINMHLEKNWGKTNEFSKYYMPAENGNAGVWKFSPVFPFPPHKNLNAFLEIEKARKNNDMSILNGEPKYIESNIEAYANGDKSQWGWDKIYGVNGVYRILKQYIDNDSLMLDKFVGSPTKTMVEKKAALDKYEKEEFVKIIMGAAPIDEFDKFASNWNKLGGEAITKEVNEWYALIKNNHK